MLVNYIFAVLGLLFYCYCGYLVSLTWISQRKPLVWRIIGIIVSNIVILPLVFSQLNQVTDFPLSISVIRISYAALALIGTIIFNQKLKSDIHRLKKHHFHPQQITLFLVLLIGILVLSYPFFLRPTGLIGGDSAYYLYTSAVALDEETLPPILDRNILITGPVILRSLTPLRLESSIEWTVIQIYILSGLAFYVLTSKWFNWKWTTLGMFIMFISRSTLRLSWDLYAFFFASVLVYLAVVYLFTFIYKNPKRVKYWLVLGLLWGSTFNIHGVISFASLALLGATCSLVLIRSVPKIRFNKLRLTQIGVVFGISFLLSSYPLIFKGWDSFERLALQPVLQKITDPSTQFESTSNGYVQFSESSAQPEETASTPIDPPKELRLQAFYQFYAPTTLIFAILGGFWFVLDIVLRRNKNPLDVPLLFFTFLHLILTQQQLFGFEWFPRRFVTTFVPLMIFFGLYGVLTLRNRLVTVSKRLTLHKKLLTIILTIFFFTWPLFRAFGYIEKSFMSSTPIEEYQFYDSFSEILPEEATIFTNHGKLYYIQGLNPFNDFRSIRINYCTFEHALLSQEEQQLLEVLLTGNQESGEQLFKSRTNQKPFYLLIDPQDFCLSESWIMEPDYPIISEFGEYRLYEVK